MDSGKLHIGLRQGRWGIWAKTWAPLSCYPPPTHVHTRTHTHTHGLREEETGPHPGKPQSERELILPGGPLNAPAGTGSLATACLISHCYLPGQRRSPWGLPFPRSGWPAPSPGGPGLSPRDVWPPCLVPWATAGGWGRASTLHHPQHHTAARGAALHSAHPLSSAEPDGCGGAQAVS